MRQSAWSLIKAALHWKIALPFLLFVAFTAGVLALLARYDVWDVSLLDEAAVWLVLAGIVLLGRAIGGTEETLAIALKDNIKILIVFEFLVATYTFPYWAEFMLVPFLGFWAALDAYAQIKHERTPVARFTSSVLSLVGLAILASAGWRAANDLQDLVTLDSARAIMLGPLLSLASLPFLYLVMVITQMEDLFIRVGPPGKSMPLHLRWAIQWRLMRYLGLRPTRIQRFIRESGYRLFGVTSTEGVQALLCEDTTSPNREPGHDSGSAA